jgi:hypothetical protein
MKPLVMPFGLFPEFSLKPCFDHGSIEPPMLTDFGAGDPPLAA